MGQLRTLAEAFNDGQDRAVWYGHTLLVSHLILTFTGKDSDKTPHIIKEVVKEHTIFCLSLKPTAM